MFSGYLNCAEIAKCNAIGICVHIIIHDANIGLNCQNIVPGIVAD